MICIECPFWLNLIMSFLYHDFSVSLIYDQSGSYTIKEYTNQIWFWAYLRSFLKLVGSCSYQDLRLDQDHLSLHFYYLYDWYLYKTASNKLSYPSNSFGRTFSSVRMGSRRHHAYSDLKLILIWSNFVPLEISVLSSP